MRKIYIFIFLICVSCSKKKYEYIESVKKPNLNGEVEISEKKEYLKADNDSTAYLLAYEKFVKSLKVSNSMKESGSTFFDLPLEFKLFDENNNNIGSTISFKDKEKKEQEIYNRIMSIDLSIKSNHTSKKDSLTIKNLSKFFVSRKEEFSEKEKFFHSAKGSPKYTNENGLYCYFATVNDEPQSLRLRFQYVADEWLFLESVIFLIDGKTYELFPSNPETDHGNGKIWEWFDEDIDITKKELLYALANAKKAKMKLNGNKYYKVKDISQNQIIAIKRTLDYYLAYGGEF